MKNMQPEIKLLWQLNPRPHFPFLPQGSKARRQAIQALGQRVASDLRTLNVIATSVLLAGILLQQRQAGGAMCVKELQEGMEWLASQVALRGGEVFRHLRVSQSAMQLSCQLAAGLWPLTAPSRLSLRRAQLLHLVNLLPEWLAVDVASRSDTDHATVRALPGWEAALCFHWRLNQLLPWFAAEALVACAAEAAAAAAEESVAANGKRIGPSCREAVLESAAWLRRLLAPEIDTGAPARSVGGMPGGHGHVTQLSCAGLEPQPITILCLHLCSRWAGRPTRVGCL